MRKPIIAANWKMNKTHLDAIHFVEELRNRLAPGDYDRCEVVICPPFTAIRSVQTTIDGDDLPMAVGAQDVHWEESGAYTGEVSPKMLAKLGVGYVIVGHSERRQYFGETDETVNKKVKSIFEHGLVPIMCVGETLDEREAGETTSRIGEQVRSGIRSLGDEAIRRLVVAYEPIWAIGTGKTASSPEAQEAIGAIRQVLREADKAAAEATRIQYGGSVKPGNIRELMEQPDIDGALVGGASLDPEEFAMLIRY